MNDDLLVELTADEAQRTQGGYEVLALSALPFLWRGSFSLLGEPSYATPISIPVQS